MKFFHFQNSNLGLVSYRVHVRLRASAWLRASAHDGAEAWNNDWAGSHSFFPTRPEFYMGLGLNYCSKNKETCI